MGDGTAGAVAKGALREQLLAARQRRSEDQRNTAARLICERALALPEVATASIVAAYASLPGEPGTEALISALLARGVTVLLPVLQPDRSLRWGIHQPGRERVNRLGIAEPPGADADEFSLTTATVVLCPGLAGDRHGNRLGRGGGSYDRALAGAQAGVLRCLLLHDEEVLDAVPTQTHDQPVDVLITPTRTLRVVR